MATVKELSGTPMPEVMNTIIDNASSEFQGLVPTATAANIVDVGNPILEYSVIQNEFLSKLVNRIALTIVDMRRATNPLAMLKKGEIPLGQDVQEIFTNPATAQSFDPTGINLLQRERPDVKNIFHRMNRQDRYKVTVSRPMITKAFTSWQAFEDLISTIVNSLYSGDNIDEFRLMKNLIGSSIVSSPAKIGSVNVPAITNDATAKAFVKAVRNHVSKFTFPSTAFNQYSVLNPTETAVTTWTPRENQILLIRSDIATEIDVEVLAVAFNMSRTDLLSRLVEVDNFGRTMIETGNLNENGVPIMKEGPEIAPNVYAVLADEALPQVYDNQRHVEDFRNPEGLYTNFFLHVWQTYSISLFANAVAFKHS